MITLYAGLRRAAALATFDWTTNGISATIVSDLYVPNLETDLVMPSVSLHIATITVEGRTVDPQGWMKHNLLYFPPFITTEVLSQVVLWRRTDNLPLIHISFVPVIPVATARPFTLMVATNFPGTARL